MNRNRHARGAGDLDQRVSISTVQQSIGTGGTVTETEVLLGKVWARVDPIRGQERVLADQERGVQSYRITARNDGIWQALTTKSKIEWGGIRFDVTAAPSVGRTQFRTVEVETGIKP